jgi:hypothetical protein
VLAERNFNDREGAINALTLLLNFLLSNVIRAVADLSSEVSMAVIIKR